MLSLRSLTAWSRRFVKYPLKSCRLSTSVNVEDEKFQRYLDQLKGEYEKASNISTTESYKIDEDRMAYLRTIQHIRHSLDQCRKHLTELEDLLADTKDEELLRMAKTDKNQLIDDRDRLIRSLIEHLTPIEDFEKFDEIVLDVTSGAGGQEAMLFAKEIFEMYRSYASYKQWTFSLFYVISSEIGGVKSASALVAGKDVYRLMKYESGVHRVQRVPVTEKTGRVHTSTCAVAVTPQPSEIQFELSSKDLRVDLYRSGGHGGQNVNMRETAVRLTHLPTKVVVECQQERSQHQNFDLAIKRLRSVLFRQKFEEQMSQFERTRKLQVGNKDRSEKIRTYNYPNRIITDHRIKEKFHTLYDALAGREAFDEIVETLQHFSRIERLLEKIEKP